MGIPNRSCFGAQFQTSSRTILTMLCAIDVYVEYRQPGHGRGVAGAAKTFHFVLPLRQIAVGAIASIARAAQGLIGLAAHIDVG